MSTPGGGERKASESMKDAMERMQNLNGDLNRTIWVLRDVSSSDKAEVQRLQCENETLRVQEAKSGRIKSLEQQVEETEEAAKASARKTKQMRDKFRHMREKFHTSMIVQAKHKARFLNFFQQNGFISNLNAAEACVDAWMHDIGLNPDKRSMDRWERSRGFSVMPGFVDSNAKPYELPDVDVDMAKKGFIAMMKRIVAPSVADEYSSDKSEQCSSPDRDEDLSDASSADEASETEDPQDGSGGDGSHDPELFEGLKDDTPSDPK
ncbi:hypothetical protein AC1031_008534 [Aphanomyces cochlioides]|nr:hypothetical protein AC1031_008534 [Aphanomyces cochlioides]